MPSTIVIDVNVYRERLFLDAAAAACRAGFSVTLPGMGLYEMTAGPGWQGNVLALLEVFLGDPNSVSIAHMTGVLRAKELNTRQAVTSFDDDAASTGVRALLRDLDNGGGPALTQLSTFRRRTWSSATRTKQQRFNDGWIRRIHEFADPTIPTARTKQIATDVSDGDWTSLRALMCEAFSLQEERDSLSRTFRSEGFPQPDELATVLCAQPSVTVLYSIAVGTLALAWKFQRGLASAPAGKVSSGVHDIDYLLAGLYAGTLVTNDGRARERFRDLQEIGARLWPDRATWFGDAWVGSTDEWLRDHP